MTDFHKKSIQSLLSEKRLAEAFAELRQTAQTLQNWQLNNRLDELEESSKYMILTDATTLNARKSTTASPQN